MCQRPSVAIQAAAWIAAIVLLVLASSARASGAAEPPPVAQPLLAGIDVDRATIPELRRAMRSGRLSARALTDFYIDRITRLNPWLHV